MTMYEDEKDLPLPHFDAAQIEFLREMKEALLAVAGGKLPNFEWDFFDVLDVPGKHMPPEGFCFSSGCAIGARAIYLSLQGKGSDLWDIIRTGARVFGPTNDQGAMRSTDLPQAAWYSWAFYSAPSGDAPSGAILARVLEALREPAR